MAAGQIFVGNINTSEAQITASDSNDRTGQTNAVKIWSATGSGAAGSIGCAGGPVSKIRAFVFSTGSSTNAGVIRYYLDDGLSHRYCFAERPIAAQTLSGTTPCLTDEYIPSTPESYCNGANLYASSNIAGGGAFVNILVQGGLY